MKENIKLILLFLLITTIVAIKVYDVGAENAKIEEAKSNYKYCIQDVEAEHNDKWNEQCSDMNRIDGCHLPTETATILFETANTNKLGCLRYFLK